MSSTSEKIASDLADKTIIIMNKTGDDRLHFQVASVLGASSQTLEEAYLTEVRVRMAGKAANKFLKDKLDDIGTAEKAPKAPE
ncbi:hypothetical protein U5922_006265 [Aquicoccus sp. G2-2]|jgi:hypothetical protein|uniref:hypothetical protein n=1 Tax=Aquicoccus sp. G2-2 TaxID=3092120 RepID=UPI002AE0A752|nr:hypothetical protein [Aquicoccus sp. G2-2]MEA1113094.1 hypothetical protein [Aquicoccus sp. G2-2]